MLVCAAKWENLAIISRLGIGSWVFVILATKGRICRQANVSDPGLREALLDTDPATAFDPFLNFTAHDTEGDQGQSLC